MPISPLIVCTHAIWNFTTEKYARHQNVFVQKGLDYFKKNRKAGEVEMIQIDMEMPTNCYDCWIRKKLGCRIANGNGWLNNKRDDDCPLKEDINCEKRHHYDDDLEPLIRFFKD